MMANAALDTHNRLLVGGGQRGRLHDVLMGELAT